MTKQEVTPVRSISLALLKLSKKEKVDLVDGTNGAPQFVARIGGIVTNVFEYANKTTGEVQMGFKGLFTLRTHNDKCYQGNSCFVPKQIEREVLTAIKNGAISTQFQYDIFLVENEKAATGYSWQSEPVLTDENREKAEKLISALLSGTIPTGPKKLAKKAA